MRTIHTVEVTLEARTPGVVLASQQLYIDFVWHGEDDGAEFHRAHFVNSHFFGVTGPVLDTWAREWIVDYPDLCAKIVAADREGEACERADRRRDAILSGDE